MSVPESLAGLAGNWEGKNRLWLMPGEPVQESDTELSIRLIARGRFAVLRNTWAYEGAPQDGMLLVGQDPQSLALTAAWIDSWHMQDAIMALQGSVGPDGRAALQGSYAAPPGPDWGWQIEIVPGPGDGLQVVMHNVTPEGQAFLAVQATYARGTRASTARPAPDESGGRR